MTKRLQDKITIITGAGSGIGRATALLFAREGAVLTLADVRGAAAEQVVAEIAAAGGRAVAAQVDVSRADQVEAMVSDVVARCGRLDVLVNNAGYGFAGTVPETTEEDFDAIMAVNVKGVFLGCKYAIPVMERQGGGVIVNTASIVSRVGIANRAAYCATKGAVASLSQAMAIDHVAKGIRINCVAPGTIESPYFDDIFARSENPAAVRADLEGRQLMNRLGKPEEIAAAMLFLASDESSFCTGSLLFADGGVTAR